MRKTSLGPFATNSAFCGGFDPWTVCYFPHHPTTRPHVTYCVMCHLLTAFPINAAEQEKYYISNVLRKPLCINVRQFVWRVEQLNANIAQMPCFYYSPNANASTKPKNVLFTEAELGAHVLRMCPLQ